MLKQTLIGVGAATAVLSLFVKKIKKDIQPIIELDRIVYAEKSVDEVVIEDKTEDKVVIEDKTEVIEVEEEPKRYLNPTERLYVDELSQGQDYIWDEEGYYDEPADNEKFEAELEVCESLNRSWDNLLKKEEGEGIMLYHPHSEEALKQYKSRMTCYYYGDTRMMLERLYDIPLIQHHELDGVSYDNCRGYRVRFFGEDSPYLDPTFGDLLCFYVDRAYFDFKFLTKDEHMKRYLAHLGLGNDYTYDFIEKTANQCMRHQLVDGEVMSIFGLRGIEPNVSFFMQFQSYLSVLEEEEEGWHDDQFRIENGVVYSMLDEEDEYDDEDY